MKKTNLNYVTLSELQKMQDKKVILFKQVVFHQSAIDGTIAVFIAYNFHNAVTVISSLDNYMTGNDSLSYNIIKNTNDELIDEYYSHFKRASKDAKIDFPKYLVTDERKFKNVYFTTCKDLQEFVSEYNTIALEEYKKRGKNVDKHSQSDEKTLEK